MVSNTNPAVFTGATLEEMVQFLKQGGIDVDTFDREGAKTLAQLHQEIVDREATLFLTPSGVIRLALRVLVLVKVGDQEWIRQVKRVYPNGTTVVRNELATITETRIRDDSAIETVIRGLKEECGLTVTKAQVHLADKNTFLELQAHCDISKLISCIEPARPSTVYPDVCTVNCTEAYIVRLPGRPWPEEERVIDDCGVKIHLAYWRPGDPVHTSNEELDDLVNKLP